MKKITLILICIALMLAPVAASAYYERNGFVIAVSGDTNIRTEPNLNGAIVGILPRGAYADYLCGSDMDERGVMWLLVDYRGTVGWVSEKYIETEGIEGDSGEDASAESRGTVVATGGDSNIRSWADLNSPVVGVLPKGQSASYMGSSFTDNRGVRWDHVCYNNLYGWVSSRYTTLYN